MAQFVTYYPRYWSGSLGQTPAPEGAFTTPLSLYQGPGESWQVVGEYASLSDAYTAADAASTAYLVEVFDRDNLAKIYSASPALTAIVAKGNVPIEYRFTTTKLDSSAYLKWERAQIILEIQGQIVVRRDPITGVLISPLNTPVTTGFFAIPQGEPAWLAIVRAAVVRTRTSGQSNLTVAAEFVSWDGDSDQPPVYWTG
jgi:hypothetical protein